MLQVGRIRDRFRAVSADISVCPGVDSASKNEYQDIPGGKGGRCVRVTTLPPSCAECLVIWSLNGPEPSGPHRTVIGIALPLPYVEQPPNVWAHRATDNLHITNQQRTVYRCSWGWTCRSETCRAVRHIVNKYSTITKVVYLLGLHR